MEYPSKCHMTPGGYPLSSKAVMYSCTPSAVSRAGNGVPSSMIDKMGIWFSLNLQSTFVEAGATWLGFQHMRHAWH
jgi:hypothetical protein